MDFLKHIALGVSAIIGILVVMWAVTAFYGRFTEFCQAAYAIGGALIMVLCGIAFIFFGLYELGVATKWLFS